MPDVLTITLSGVPTAIDLVASNTTLDRLRPYPRGGIPELHFSRLLGTLKPLAAAALPDPWSGQPVSLTMMSGTLVFSGDVCGYTDSYMDGFGWLREYRALGLLDRANLIPVTDSQTLTDTSIWDLPGDDPNFIGARAGLTVGAIVADILAMAVNAVPLNAAGLGGYISPSPSPWTLPASTVADLALLTIIPPSRASIAGERILQSLEAFVQTYHPNQYLYVDPVGTIRFLDPRLFSVTTLTLGSDPRLMMPTLTRDLGDCYSQVEVRGNTLVRAVTLQTAPWPGSSSSDGGLQEAFAWGSLSGAAAKAAWVPAGWSQPNQYGAPYDTGSCTCPSTTTVTVTSANASMTWGVDALSQANLQGNIILYADVITGIDQLWQARVVSNTALTAGGTSTLTLDIALPALTYNAYNLFALNAGPNVVGRRYKVSNAAIAAAMQLYFPYPQAYVNSQGTAGSLTSTPIGTVMFSAFGGTMPPYNTGFDGITIDPVNGYIYFDKPTQVVAGGLSLPVTWPQNVQAFLPIAVGTLSAFAPSSTTYSGTLYTVEGISRTKIITCIDWRDYGNQASMDLFASEWLSSSQDVVVEGTVPYLGLIAAFLLPGNSVSIAGISGSTAYISGWESLALAIVDAEIKFNCGSSGTSYEMGIQVSNRRGRYSISNYLRPNITGAQFGSENGLSGHAAEYVGTGGITPDMADAGSGYFDPSGMGTPATHAQMLDAEKRQTQDQQVQDNRANDVPTNQSIVKDEHAQDKAEKDRIQAAAKGPDAGNQDADQ